MSSPIRRITKDDDDEAFDRVPSWLTVGRRVAKLPRASDMPEPTFSGDRALTELSRRLSRTAGIVPEPPLEAYEQSAENQQPMMLRFLSLVGVAMVIAWAIVLLPSLTKSVMEISQTPVREASTEAERGKLVDRRGTTEASPRAQYGSAAVNQPRVVAAMPLLDPPAERVLADRPPSAATRSPRPAAKSVTAAALPAPPSVPDVAPTSSAAAATPSASQFNPVTSAPTASPGSPSAQARTVLAAPATASASLDPAPARTLAQLAPASPQGDVSAALAPAPQSSAASVRNRTVPALDIGEVAMLLSRGKDFLSAGDLSSAQLLFRRAAEAGSAEAALALASTYDPRYLAAHNVVGVIGDEVKARAWYQRAAELGSPEAARMLAQLGAK